MSRIKFRVNRSAFGLRTRAKKCDECGAGIGVGDRYAVETVPWPDGRNGFKSVRRLCEKCAKGAKRVEHSV